MRSSFVASLAFVGLSGALFGLSPVAAQTMTDSPQRVEHRRADLSGAPGMEVIASTAEYQKGDSVMLHIHHGVEAAYVVQGATIQVPGKDPVTLVTGTSVLNLRDAPHAGWVVVSDTPLKLFTVHIVDKGKPLYDPVPFK
jgi:quercetin dioxygenase-like cupin family protein